MFYAVPYIWSLLFLVGASTSADVDVVTLVNGDRISGRIVSIEAGVLTLETDYAGALAIQTDAVEAIETSAERTVMLADETVVVGVLETADAAAGIRTEEGWRPLSLDAVTDLAADVETLEARRMPEKEKRWTGNVEAGLALRSGNTDTTDFKVSSQAKRTGDRSTLQVGVNTAYGAADQTINTRLYAGNFRWQYYMRERFYLYTLGLAERDDGRKLELRLQGGPGIGYELIKRENRDLSADIGLTMTYERWRPFTPWERTRERDTRRSTAFNRLYRFLTAPEEGDAENRIPRIREMLADIRDPLRDTETRDEEYLNLRIGVNYRQKIFKSSTLSEELVIMPNLEDIGEFRVLSEFALTTPLTEALSLRTTLKTEYDSLAKSRNVESWDNTLMTQIRYKF